MGMVPGKIGKNNEKHVICKWPNNMKWNLIEINRNNILQGTQI